ncbi:MAG: GIY-YIG nuclease family protein [Pseudomonadota bacterium]
MEVNDLLQSAGVVPEQTAVVLNKTTQQPLRDLFPALVFERPDLFDAYQSVHSRQASATLKKRRFLASFIPLGHFGMLFAGIYEIVSVAEKPTAEIYADPRFNALATEYGAVDTAPEKNMRRFESQLFFTTRLTDHLVQLRGRLQIALPPGRTYARLAENLTAPIVAISADPIMAPPPPPWDCFIVDAPTITSLPRSWRDQLRQWRGVYLIVDQKDGARYVGSAYGQENLLGRWRDHIAGDTGLTKALKSRQPENSRFSILQLLAPTAPVEEVVAIENTWKERLHTRAFGLNEN